jgi:hypothetical protein
LGPLCQFKKEDQSWYVGHSLLVCTQLTQADEHSAKARQFVFDVYSTHEHLLCYEDLDGDSQITIDDEGPKVSFFLWIFCPTIDIRCAGDIARISSMQ